MKIIANKSILHNNLTACTFLASELDQQVQTGTRESDSHIEWMGDLTIPVQSTDPGAGKEVRQIKYPSKDEGRSGCYYSDTEYSSEDVVYGYNMAIDHMKDLNKDFKSHPENNIMNIELNEKELDDIQVALLFAIKEFDQNKKNSSGLMLSDRLQIILRKLQNKI